MVNASNTYKERTFLNWKGKEKKEKKKKNLQKLSTYFTSLQPFILKTYVWKNPTT